jgi:hypothetical protein
MQTGPALLLTFAITLLTAGTARTAESFATAVPRPKEATQ